MSSLRPSLCTCLKNSSFYQRQHPCYSAIARQAPRKMLRIWRVVTRSPLTATAWVPVLATAWVRLCPHVHSAISENEPINTLRLGGAVVTRSTVTATAGVGVLAAAWVRISLNVWCLLPFHPQDSHPEWDCLIRLTWPDITLGDVKTGFPFTPLSHDSQ